MSSMVGLRNEGEYDGSNKRSWDAMAVAGGDQAPIPEQSFKRAKHLVKTPKAGKGRGKRAKKPVNPEIAHIIATTVVPNVVSQLKGLRINGSQVTCWVDKRRGDTGKHQTRTNVYYWQVQANRRHVFSGWHTPDELVERVKSTVAANRAEAMSLGGSLTPSLHSAGGEGEDGVLPPAARPLHSLSFDFDANGVPIITPYLEPLRFGGLPLIIYLHQDKGEHKKRKSVFFWTIVAGQTRLLHGWYSARIIVKRMRLACHQGPAAFKDGVPVKPKHLGTLYAPNPTASTTTTTTTSTTTTTTSTPSPMETVPVRRRLEVPPLVERVEENLSAAAAVLSINKAPFSVTIDSARGPHPTLPNTFYTQVSLRDSVLMQGWYHPDELLALMSAAADSTQIHPTEHPSSSSHRPLRPLMCMARATLSASPSRDRSRSPSTSSSPPSAPIMLERDQDERLSSLSSSPSPSSSSAPPSPSEGVNPIESILASEVASLSMEGSPLSLTQVSESVWSIGLAGSDAAAIVEGELTTSQVRAVASSLSDAMWETQVHPHVLPFLPLVRRMTAALAGLSFRGMPITASIRSSRGAQVPGEAIFHWTVRTPLASITSGWISLTDLLNTIREVADSTNNTDEYFTRALRLGNLGADPLTNH